MWNKLIKQEQEKSYYKELIKKVNNQRTKYNIYPKEEDVFKAFELTPFAKVKVVIIGQDPYHGYNQAHGLAFSSLDKKTPASLRNIKKVLKLDLGINASNSNDLTPWALQGVLLINTILTVKEKYPSSHKDYGWQRFTLTMIKALCKENRPIVFILWGNHAISYKKYITNDKHLVIESSHPSPFSAHISFMQSKPFSKTNKFLTNNNLSPINFNI